VREAAVRLLARREHARRELERKLAERGYPEGPIEEALAGLAEAGLQSDRRFAESWVRQRAGRGYGPRRILAELSERGVDPATAQTALDEEAPDFDLIACDWYRRKYRDRTPKDFRERASRAQALYRRGFESEQIRALTGD
jgi:regulatory protein